MRSQHLKASAATIAFSLFLAGSASATTVTTLADYDGINTGVLVGTRMSEAALGSGVCGNFSAGTSIASGNALCGSDLNAYGVVHTVTFSGIDFDLITGLSFALGAYTSLAFEAGDYISVTANGANVADFAGSGTALVDQGGGWIAEEGAVNLTGGVFETFTYLGSQGSGTGDLVFSFYTTADNEFVGLDSVSVTEASAVPLPSALPLALAGFGLMGGLAARRRRKA